LFSTHICKNHPALISFYKEPDQKNMSRQLKILHLEDNPYDSELITNELKKGRINFIKRLISTREELEKELVQFQPDIILSDHSLPSFSSKDALKIVNHHGQRIPFILVAGTVSDEYAVEIMKEGAYDYVLKDRVQRLPASILLAFEKSRMEIENAEYLDALQKSEANLKTIFDNTDIGYIFLDNQFNIVSFNGVAGSGFLIENKCALTEGRNIIDCLQRKNGPSMEKKLVSVQKGNVVNLESGFKNEDGKQIWYQMKITPVKDSRSETIGIIIAISYITERKNAELEREKLTDALRISNEDLKKMVERIQTAREEERLHIAREVHDELGQVLSALKIEVSMVRKKIAASNKNIAYLLDFNQIVKLIDNSILSVKKIAKDLRPEMLDEIGLMEALRWQVEEFSKNTGIATSLQIKPEFAKLALDIHTSTAIYRIVQEGLTNISRHARAASVKIMLKYQLQNILLTIKDNGTGITDSQKNQKNSFGITGIKERVFLLNGILEISGRPGKGTIIFVQIPYEK
jgi:two-component system, NarL family, sensor histidine kinase UhpB